ncbi:hypothetical protein AgCh_034955 [Apium graveolens]
MMETVVIGTKNVIVVAAEAKVCRVVFTSSIGAVYMSANRSPDEVIDESCWSDLELCKNTRNWYCYGKAMAEQVAREEGKHRGVDMVALNPVLVIGPVLPMSMLKMSRQHTFFSLRIRLQPDITFVSRARFTVAMLSNIFQNILFLPNADDTLLNIIEGKTFREYSEAERLVVAEKISV